MNNEILKNIDEKMAVLIALNNNEVYGKMSGESKIAYLFNLGATRNTIAKVLNIKPKSVTEALSRLRKKGLITGG